MKLKNIIFLFLGVLLEIVVHFWVSSKTDFITKNYGVSFSMNWFNPLVLNILFVIFIGWFYLKNESYFFGLILIGGIVNMIDRLIFGYVRDYWTLGGILINNLNDWLIGLGVSLFLLDVLWKK